MRTGPEDGLQPWITEVLAQWRFNSSRESTCKQPLDTLDADILKRMDDRFKPFPQRSFFVSWRYNQTHKVLRRLPRNINRPAAPTNRNNSQIREEISFPCPPLPAALSRLVHLRLGDDPLPEFPSSPFAGALPHPTIQYACCLK